MPAATEVTGLQRTLEAGLLVPEHGAVTGWAALGWLGASWSTGRGGPGASDLPVPLSLSRHSIRAQPGVVLCEERRDPREVSLVDGLQVTSPVRSVCFEMRYGRSLAAAVVALDMAAFDDLVSVAEAAQWLFGHPSYTGIGQGRDAVPLAGENSWSPMEVLTRVGWVVDAGLPAPLANRPIFDLSGRRLATPDLLDPDAGVIAEYDGGVHLATGQRKRDRIRDETYRDHRLEHVVVMEGDLREPADLVARLHAAYARAGRHTGRRTWTIEQPDWWVDTSTVELRRALTEEERAVWLNYRAAG